MTFWGFIWPGLGQLLCGQTEKGVVLMIASFVLNIILLVTLVLPLAMCIAGAIDANRVAGALARGKPVRRWAFFPK
jgi:TM2 domain-containing membrane protein YozV